MAHPALVCNGKLASAQRPEEGADVFDEQFRFFHRGEVTAPRHLGPPCQAAIMSGILRECAAARIDTRGPAPRYRR
jgi:hypothetical protein